MKNILLFSAFLAVSQICRAQEKFMILTETRYWDSAGTSDGYTLFGTAGISFLIDFQGRVINTWSLGTNPRFTEGGTLLDATGGSTSGQNSWKELSWNGDPVWQYSETRTNYHGHDDFIKIYNPKLLDSTFVYIANRDLTALQCLNAGCDPSFDYTGAQMDAVVEVDLQGNVVWEWWFFDHVVQDIDPSKPTYGIVANTPGRLDLNLPGNPVSADWTHCNSVDYNQDQDLLVINSTHGEFYVIDHGNTFIQGNPTGSIALAAGPAGDFKYRFGDPARYGQGNPPLVLDNWEKTTAGHKQLGGSHDVRWIRPGLPGAGNFLVFNNAQNLFELTPQSYVMEINPYLNSAGINTGSFVNPPAAGYSLVNSPDGNLMKEKKNISKQVVWRYSAKNNTSFFSTTGSGAQRLPDGNTLVFSANDGHIFEISPSDTSIVWEYINPLTAGGIKTLKADHYPAWNSVCAARRYGPDHPALAGHDLTPGPALTGNTPDYLTPADLALGTNSIIQNITIASGQSFCYEALQSVTVAGSGTSFVVQPGGSATFIAGGNIQFRTGTKVKSGGYLTGRITTTGQYCNAQNAPLTNVEPLLPASKDIPSLVCYPNPTAGIVRFETTGIPSSETIIARLCSARGDQVMSLRFSGAATYWFSLEGVPAGLYVARFIAVGWVETVKLLKVDE